MNTNTAEAKWPVSKARLVSSTKVMVAAMRTMLFDWGADEDNIRTEEFAGY